MVWTILICAAIKFLEIFEDVLGVKKMRKMLQNSICKVKGLAEINEDFG